MKKRILSCICLYAFLPALILGAPAYAREKSDATVSVGGLRLEPSISVSESYDDNLRTEERDENGDFITRVKLGVKMDMAEKPSTVQVKIGAEQALYKEETDINHLDYYAGIKIRHMLDEKLRWDANADYRHAHALPGDDEADPANDANEAIPYDHFRATSSVSGDIGPVTVTPRVAYVRYDYSDVRRVNGTLIDENARDRNDYEIGGRLDFKTDHAFAPFVDGKVVSRFYDDVTPQRDSQGGEYLVGVRYKPSSAIFGEIALGYMDRAYDAVEFDDIHAFDASARWEWMYAPDSKLKLSFNRGIAEVTDAGTGGAVRSDVRASVIHALFPDISGKIALRYLDSDYRGGNGATSGTSDRHDRFYEARVGAGYTIGDGIILSLDYTHSKNASNRDTAEYDRNVIVVAVKTEF